MEGSVTGAWYHRGMDGVERKDVSALRRRVEGVAGLKLLLLFGSRARGTGTASADWDFGYLATDDVDVSGLLARLVTATDSDRVDLVDLTRASGLLRHRAAQDGLVVFEVEPGSADRFRLDAARFWCEAAPVLARAYDDLLAGLGR
jgi:predicted nucleotidyltransferase